MASELGVQTIQHTNGTDAMTIDSSGRVKQPAKPAFSVYLDANLASADYRNPTKVPFDTKDFDIGNNVALDDDAVFTAPVDGIYYFNCQLLMDSITAAPFVDLRIYIDDSIVNSHADYSYRALEDPQGGNYVTVSTTPLIQLNANQTVTPYFAVNTDSSSNVRTGTRFTGFLVA